MYKHPGTTYREILIEIRGGSSYQNSVRAVAQAEASPNRNVAEGRSLCQNCGPHCPEVGVVCCREDKYPAYLLFSPSELPPIGQIHRKTEDYNGQRMQSVVVCLPRHRAEQKRGWRGGGGGWAGSEQSENDQHKVIKGWREGKRSLYCPGNELP